MKYGVAWLLGVPGPFLCQEQTLRVWFLTTSDDAVRQPSTRARGSDDQYDGNVFGQRTQKVERPDHAIGFALPRDSPMIPARVQQVNALSR